MVDGYIRMFQPIAKGILVVPLEKELMKSPRREEVSNGNSYCHGKEYPEGK
jgi:hypothetical protein